METLTELRLAKLRHLRQLQAAAREATGAKRWYDDPVGFTAHCVELGADGGLTDYQREILAELQARRRVAVRGPHGLGKTTGNALAVLWFALTRDAAGVDWKCITTAGAWRQLEEYLWPEIHKWAGRLRWDIIGRDPFARDELLNLHLRLRHGSAFAVASDTPALIEGAHADEILYIFDESKAIPPELFDAAEGAFSGATRGRAARALASSTPGAPAGRFYDIHARKPGFEDWWTRHVRLDETVAAGRVSPDWADARRRQWGAGSALYANRVLGEFHADDEDGVIPLGWVEAAVERWRVWDALGRPEQPGRRVIGVDVATTGRDKTVLAIRQGPTVQQLVRYEHGDTPQTTGRILEWLRWPQAMAVVDAIGVGEGPTSLLQAQGMRVVGLNVAQPTARASRQGNGFLNIRSAMWWAVREELDPAFGASLALPDDDELVGDLTTPHWKLTAAGKIQLESREDIVKRLGRSPDAGTAVCQALWLPSSLGASASDPVPYEPAPGEPAWPVTAGADSDGGWPWENASGY